MVITPTKAKKGNFTDVSYNGKNYSVADWNKAQQAKPAGPHHNY